MGGVIVRHLHDPRIHWERIVMLAPPNRGSQLAAGLVEQPGVPLVLRPGRRRARRWRRAGPRRPRRSRVIAGTRSLALTNLTSWTVGPAVRRRARRNDGTVAVDETRLDGMAAFAEVDATHTWIMNDARASSALVRAAT